MRNIFYIFLFVFTTSCGFNKVFLVPTKLDNQNAPFKAAYNKSADTIVISDKVNFQPQFIAADNKLVDYPYQIESKVFNSKSGSRLNVWIISPDSNYNSRNIIFFHGNAGNIVSQHKLMLPFVKAGFKVYVVDYSGFGFSTGKATRKNVLLDGNSAIEYFTNSDTTARWIIYGQSLGGHLTPVVALANENLIDGIVVEGAFTSHHDIGANSAGFIARLLIAEKYSAKKAIKQFKKPVLIIHSTEDNIIPYRMGEKLFEVANEPKQFYQVDKCHICAPIYYSENILQKMDVMLRK